MIARMFYTGGLPFTFSRIPYYQSTYTFAANNNLGGYVPPAYNRLRTTLLDQEKKHVELSLAPIKNTWGAKEVTIVTDGWSDPQRIPLINFMACCESGPMLIKSVNCACEVKDKEFIANLLREVIDEVGHQNIVQVITDNASNCKGSGEIIKVIMIKRFKLVKRALEGMVMCDQWTSYRDDDQGKARLVREKILDEYW
ncbi:hypothetical protein QQ045_019859 [Rhodiola kirilowii]